ncbi:similar to Saccharomyces cerevisiae YBR131W CCZ1 Protein involved in vacuolar assembly, essential for autophagy and the cytoplasm-to-vacuole pathway [Maudiozyma barnettii]|uniref:Similar to Saccharomyces cerevisiae YBR131W CCZ1 Protein involved in vacuolar assembly, essential for autophagy and the cytoplasm-to-vacuole pathway n=1 Tax=Maudiozyma barnettii TaxID=61262 RepID=A0A8H2VAY0_9SACH|nr:Ccz1p [Kazachstania barnettii]CAB4251911.1 similar to Saccharomyces cerevisiae YBR131W CCZ1 Protein involved in vacuolar assembly, essential for autophagy and the cytoplasm-to-vacuole pathway [Kazachstania barnettii]CAD1778243.1 similar to Saccharomyces cerevisiae YBR131W CCZ1 Protein involved in vacuolar assembly, essential for autophagy and the cytoplasm-to-vacuole pathway [Kazachstania barnettii]
MIKDLVVIDPTRSHNDEDTHKSLILFHEFGEAAGSSSLNDKLNRVGIIQGLWSLTQSFEETQEEENEKVIELDNEVILVIKVESRYFMAISINEYENFDDTSKGTSNIPFQFYLGHLWLCYKFFVLKHGAFSKFNDNADLTNNLNEHIITFWNDIYLKPDTLIRQGINVLWPNAYKTSELADLLESETATLADDESWDTIINRKILLQEESYLGVKDILIYNLPSYSKDRATGILNDKRSRIGTKYFGLVRNFCQAFESLPDISNWIYHLTQQYDVISSHVLAGNTHYKEVPTTDDNNDDDDDDDDAGGFTTQTTGAGLATFGNKLYHNMTLPISFAYDVVQEVGVTAGVSSSMSYLKSYMPSWTTSTPNELETNRSSERKRYGYLISPLAQSSLPSNYKIIKLNLKFGSQAKFYNVLFWYYENMLAIIICDENFETIWNHSYLNDLSFILSLSMEKLHNKLETVKRPMQENFGYLIVDKNKSIPELRSSIPSCIGLFNPYQNESPLNLVIEGLDKFFSIPNLNIDKNGENVLGIDIMGSLFSTSKPRETSEISKRKSPYNNTFLDAMETDKLWTLYEELLIFLDSLNKSETKLNISEERLLTLSNGVLCYIKNDHQRTLIILKNWFDNKYDDYPTKEVTLFNNLGIDVTSWWAKKKYDME